MATLTPNNTKVGEITISGHLRLQNGKYQMVIAWKGEGIQKGTKQISTGLPEKGNKKRAESLLLDKKLEIREKLKAEAIMNKKQSKTSGGSDSKQKYFSRRITPDMPFSDYMKIWHERCRGTVEEDTWAGYGSNVRIISPYFSELEITIEELTEDDLEDFYQEQISLGKSKNTVHHYHVTIHSALKELFEKHKIQYNPADLAKRPVPDKFIGKFLTVPELTKVLGLLKDHKLEFGAYCAGYYGLRRSEVVGLQWHSFDFDTNTFTIRNTVTNAYIDGKTKTIFKERTKSKSSMRCLPIVAPFREILLRLREQQEQYRVLCGNCYNTNYLDYVYVDPMGNLIKPGYLTTAFPKFLEKVGIRRIRYHDLRHTCASVLYANGVDLKEIQHWLGHSDISTTSNIYAHFMDDPFTNTQNALLLNWY